MLKIKEKTINNTYDKIFKALFINNINVLGKMISDITGIPYNILKDNITLEINEIPITRRGEKFKKCDFIVRIKKDIVVNIEINTSNYRGLKVKNLSYVFSLFATSSKESMKYNNDLNLSQINLNTFSEGEDELNIYEFRNTKNNQTYFNNLKIFSLDVVKCGEIWYSCANKKQLSNYIKWGALLSCDNLEDISIIMSGVIDDKEIEELESRLEGLNMDANGIMTKKEAREWGEWIKNSLYEEVIEQTNIINIKSMLNNNLDIDLISKITGKPKEEINKIKKSTKQ